MAHELSDSEQKSSEYFFLDLTRPFLTSQLQLAREAGWKAHAVHANAEILPFADASVDLVIDNENLADMTPIHFKKEEFESWTGATPEHQRVLEMIRRLRLPLDQPLPDEVIVNYGAIAFLMELWRVFKAWWSSRAH